MKNRRTRPARVAVAALACSVATLLASGAGSAATTSASVRNTSAATHALLAALQQLQAERKLIPTKAARCKVKCVNALKQIAAKSKALERTVAAVAAASGFDGSDAATELGGGFSRTAEGNLDSALKNLSSASHDALDYRTGQYKWKFPKTRHDIWDSIDEAQNDYNQADANWTSGCGVVFFPAASGAIAVRVGDCVLELTEFAIQSPYTITAFSPAVVVRPGGLIDFDCSPGSVPSLIVCPITAPTGTTVSTAWPRLQEAGRNCSSWWRLRAVRGTIW